MELHIYKTAKTPDGRIISTPDLDCTYHLGDNIYVSSVLISKMMKLFDKEDVRKISGAMFGAFALLQKTGALKAGKMNDNFDPMELLNAQNIPGVEKLLNLLLSVIYDNFDKAIDTVQIALEENKIYLTREQVGTLPPTEMLAVFLLVFRQALPFLGAIKRA